MRDKRPVDELSIEELERILAIKRREARQERLTQLRREGRVIDTGAPPPIVVQEPPPMTAAPAAAALLTPASAIKPAPLVSPAPTAPIPPGSPLSMLPQFDDEPGAQPIMVIDSRAVQERERAQRQAARRRMDRLLLLVEVAAVIAIIVIGAVMVTGVQTLERETAEAQRLSEEQRRAGIPTLEPTPTLRIENYVLPGGHTVDVSTGRAQFNFSEVPSHLAPLVQSQWIQPIIERPAPTSETALNLTIPSLNLSQAIVPGVDWEALKQGIGQLPNGVNPGDPSGNLVLAAHNDIYGELFRHLDQLEPGDEFTVQTATRLFTYRVTERRIVAPTDVYVLENRGSATATLISCYPYQVNDKRIVVFAERITT
jgi:sortase A